MQSLIRNRNEVKQVIDFTGVQNGKMHPSDIDAVLEFDNRILILIEVKKVNNNIPVGQRMLLERICDSWHTPENAIVLKVEHDFRDSNVNIPLEKCWVTNAYYKGNWCPFEKAYSFVDYINNLGRVWECNKCQF
jgi:hypothetical protein